MVNYFSAMIVKFMSIHNAIIVQ